MKRDERGIGPDGRASLAVKHQGDLVNERISLVFG